MPEPVEDKVNLYKQALYDACRATGDTSRLFTQEDLLDMAAVPNRDLATLANCINRLVSEKLFVPCIEDNKLAWRWRPVVEAEKYQQCDNEEQALVYGVVDDAGNEGIWSQTIPKKLKMHDNVFKTAIKHLLQKKLITTFKSVQHPTKKMYIKATLRPSQNATGDAFFTDQTLDEAFVDALLAVTYDYIKQKSTQLLKLPDPHRRQPKKVIKGQSPKTKKRTADQMSGAAEAAADDDVVEVSSGPATETLVPMPPGYKSFPTVSDITAMLSKVKITPTALGEGDVQNLVNVLKWDKLIAPVKVGEREGWRITRASKQKTVSWSKSLQEKDADDAQPTRFMNAFADIPCGKCPSFDLCAENSPVGPHNCRYFQKWLGN